MAIVSWSVSGGSDGRISSGIAVDLRPRFRSSNRLFPRAPPTPSTDTGADNADGPTCLWWRGIWRELEEPSSKANYFLIDIDRTGTSDDPEFKGWYVQGSAWTSPRRTACSAMRLAASKASPAKQFRSGETASVKFAAP